MDYYCRVTVCFLYVTASFSVHGETSRNAAWVYESPSGQLTKISGNRNQIYDFASNLYLTVAKLKTAEENMLISPFSIRAVMGLVYLTSRGNTAEEIKNALLFPSSHDELVSGLAKHMSSTKMLQNSKFDVGNGIFLKEGLFLNRTFAQIVKHRLNSEVTNCNFSDRDRSAERINTWVRNITKDRIRTLVGPVSLNPTTSVFMANALYFSGQWELPFELMSTREGPFVLASGKTVMVPMMQAESSFHYNYIPELRSTGISIPFKDSRFELIILKPEMGLSRLEADLPNYPLNLIPTEIKKQTRSVLLRIPKFRLDVHYDLVNVMQKLGIQSLFDPVAADLSGLTKAGDKHFVSEIVHQTALDVNEKGADAAASTSVSFYPISSPSFFTVDVPFLFLLNDRLTGPVFIGRLANPSRTSTHEL